MIRFSLACLLVGPLVGSAHPVLSGSYYEASATRPAALIAKGVAVENGGSLDSPSRKISLTAPSGQRYRTLRIWLALQNGAAVVHAGVSGGAGAWYSDHTFRAGSAAVVREYVFHFSSAAPSEKILITAQMISRPSDKLSGLAVLGVKLGNEVENKPPSVRIVSPENLSRFRDPADFEVEAEASDPDGKIRKVEFYGASVAIKLGEASAPPYRFRFSRKDAYAGSFCARAYDEHGASTDSAVVRFRVEAGDKAPVPRTPALRYGTPSPGDPTKGWEGVASIVELPGGDLLAAWFAGKYELSRDSAIWASRLKAGAKDWTKPFVLIDAPGVAEGNPALFFHKGVLWCFYSQVHGNSIEYSRMHYSKSVDVGKTWQPAVLMPQPEFEYPTGTLPSTRPQVLSNGDILLPVNRESYDPDAKKQWYSLFLRSSDDGATWTETEPIYSLPGNIQPTVAQLRDGSLLAFFRMRGLNGNVWQSRSKDGGRTWMELQRTEFPSPSARVALVRTGKGNLVLVYNHSTTIRTPLNVTMSTDEGKTWSPPKAIETGGYAFTYPYALQASDGKIHIVYNDHYQAVRHAVIDEAWLDYKVQSAW